jgi:sugar/nucleoside kinase (ribokinase family)
MAKGVEVIVVGELNVDLILNQIEGFPEVGKEKLVGEMTLTLGSSSAIFASNLSSFGTKVSFLGKIGDDIFGNLVIQSLTSGNVQTDLIVRDKNLKTGATIVLNYDEDRAMITHAGAMEKLNIDDVSSDKLSTARHLHFSSYFLQPGIRKDVSRMFEMAKDLGLTTSFDAQWDPDEKWDLDLKAILPNVDVFLPNQQELFHLTGMNTIDEAFENIQDFANTVVVKRGNAGSIVLADGNKYSKEPFLNRNVIDAIGAGDSFNAGFIHKYINGASIIECQTFGNLMGAISTTAAGGTAAFRNYDSMVKTAKDYFGYSLQ